MEDRIIQVFCAICKARNDATFDYCLHCRTPPLWDPIAPPTRRAVGIVIDESRLAARKAAVALATSHNAGQKRKLRVSDKFDAFISARSTQAWGWASATNQDVLDWLCWLDPHEGGTKVVHSPNCAAVGSESLERCSPGSSRDSHYAAQNLRQGVRVQTQVRVLENPQDFRTVERSGEERQPRRQC